MSNATTVYGTISSSTVAVSVALAERYNYLTIENLSPPGAATPELQLIWVRTDGTAAVKEADGCFSVNPGERMLVAPMNGIWTQAALNIPFGTNNWQGASLYGRVANPGTSVSVILDNGTTLTNFSVEAAG
jgi:hypothetical protein